LTFEVEDTGIGIAAEDRVRIFDAFVQVGKRGRQKGTGLGLAITRQFIELMGGTIQIESTKDSGSRFAATLSVERAEGFETKRSESREGSVIGLKPGEPEYRILIVEDEPESRLLLQRMLHNAGFHVRVGENGAQGVEMFQSWRTHFIWMDWRMPVMGGAEATRRIRSLEGGTEVRIAAVSASTFASERSAVLATGVDDFIRKPYSATEIFDCLGRHLQVHYRFARADSVPRKQHPSIRPEELEALPEELRAELAEALVRLDTSRVVRAIKCVEERDSALGSMLAIVRAGWPIPRSSTRSTAFKRHQSGKGHECVPLPEELRAELADTLIRLDSSRVVRIIKCVRNAMHPSDRRLLGARLPCLFRNPRCN